MTQRRTACGLMPGEPIASPRLQLIVRHKDRRLNCPLCETPTLVEIVQSGIPIDRCRRCGGVWLDPGEFECFAGP